MDVRRKYGPIEVFQLIEIRDNRCATNVYSIHCTPSMLSKYIKTFTD